MASDGVKRGRKGRSSHTMIQAVERGQQISGVYCVEDCYVKTAKNGQPYSDVTLRDRSGSAICRFWGRVEASGKGDFVHVTADVGDYKGNLQIVLRTIDKVDPPSDMSDWVPVVDGYDEARSDLSRLLGRLPEKAEEIGTPVARTCCAVVGAVFTDQFLKRFIASPYTVMPNYGVVGGLLVPAYYMPHATRLRRT